MVQTHTRSGEAEQRFRGAQRIDMHALRFGLSAKNDSILLFLQHLKSALKHFTTLLFLMLAHASSTSGAGIEASFAAFDRKAAAGEPVAVAFLGGSLTWGTNASDPMRTSWRALISQWLRQRYPKTPFVFHDAAIGGTGSKLAIFRLDRDVLAHQPDLVFLDFTMNDGAESADLPGLAAYESLLRRMIARGIPVMQMFLCFKQHVRAGFDYRTLPRYREHLKLAEAYQTGRGDALQRMHSLVSAGEASLEMVWPFDGAHPDDIGYRIFFEAARDGLEEAIRDQRTCRLPAQPVFSDCYAAWQRITLADCPLPEGWRRAKAFRNAMWFDGLSSRWMGDVAAGKTSERIAPLRIEFTGTLVGLFGEKDGNSAAFRVRVDGKPLLRTRDPQATEPDIWPNHTGAAGGGCLFSWIELSDSLPPGKHLLEIEPVFDPAHPGQELRIESICAAGEQDDNE